MRTATRVKIRGCYYDNIVYAPFKPEKKQRRKHKKGFGSRTSKGAKKGEEQKRGSCEGVTLVGVGVKIDQVYQAHSKRNNTMLPHKGNQNIDTIDQNR